MADLSQLFQYAPGTAAYFTGQNQGMGLQHDSLMNSELANRIAIEQAKEARAAEMQPYDIRNKDLTNQGLEAEIGGKRADSTSKKLKAEREAATQQSAIDATNAENTGKVDQEQVARLERGQKIMLDIGAQLGTVPGPLRKQALSQILQQNGMNPNAPHLQQLLNMDPEQIPAAATSLSQRLGQQLLAMNPAAQATIQGHQISAAAQRYTADQQLAGTKYTADKGLEKASVSQANKAKALTLQQAILRGGDPKKVQMIAKYQMEVSDDPEEKAMMAEVIRFADNVMQRDGERRGAGGLGFSTDENGAIKPTPKTQTPLQIERPKKLSDEELLKLYGGK